MNEFSRYRVAIVHDWLNGFRGGERVLEAIVGLFPEAEIYTLFHVKGSTSEIIESRKIHASWLQKIPRVEKYYRYFLPIFPFALRGLKIPQNIDLVVSSSHCVCKGIAIPHGSKHLSYIHSPMRYIYDQFESYFGSFRSGILQWPVKLLRSYLRLWDRNSNRAIDLMVANSHFVAERILMHYGTRARVLHPFVELRDFPAERILPSDQRDSFYLMVSAFAPNKRIDLAIEAFKENKKNLIIVGEGQDSLRLHSLASGYQNIEFKGSLPRELIIDLFFRAQALIFPGVEDFGITPLEALAAGTPVIAYAGGGVLETLTARTAQFFSEASAESLRNAIIEFEGKSYVPQQLRKRAEEFSRESFVDQFRSLAQGLLDTP